MKSILTLSFVFLLTMSVFADTNQTIFQQASSVATQMGSNAVSTTTSNINEAVVDILRGVKSTGGEIYQASKTTITKSVDFTIEQTPLVVNEFIKWKLAESIIYTIAFSVPAFILLYISKRVRIYGESDKVPEQDRYGPDKENYIATKWITRIIGFILLLIVFCSGALTITKITIAPRVYLIEYVVDTIQNVQHSNQ